MISKVERAAMHGEAMPVGLSLWDQIYFLGLSSIYKSYRSGQIEKSDGSKYKKELQMSIAEKKEQLAFLERYQEQAANMWQSLEEPSNDYIFARQEDNQEKALQAADKMWEAIFRMPFPQKKD